MHGVRTAATGMEGLRDAIDAWQCIGCGRVEAPQNCVGICEDRRVKLVHASAYAALSGLDPSVVSFAAFRLATHWGRDEEEIDVMITDRLLRAVSGLIDELRPVLHR
mgnify:CR=1 FL=1